MLARIVALAMVASTAQAAEPDLPPKFEELVMAVGVAANFAGRCERFTTDAESAAFLESLRDIDGKPGRSEVDDAIAPILLDQYARGRSHADRLKMTATDCRVLLRKQGARMDEAARALSGVR